MRDASSGRWLGRIRADARLASLLHGAGGFMLVQIAGTAIAFLAQVLLARGMGATSYGDYVVAYGWVTLLALPATMGHGTAALRFVAQYLAAQDWARLRAYLGVALLTTALASCTAAVLLATLSLLAPRRLGASLASALVIGAVALPLQSALVVMASILRGLRLPVLSQVPSSLVQHSVLIACAGAAVAAGEAPSGAHAMRFMVLASAAALVLSAALLWRALPHPLRQSQHSFETRTWALAALPMFWITALNVVMQRADVLIVGAQLGSEPAGIYSAASRLSLLISFGLTAVNAWAAPTIADLHARGDRAELQRMVRLAARAVTAFTLPVALGVIAMSAWLLGLFGAGFQSGQAALWVLCAGQVVNALLGPVGYLMTMTGNQREAARILTFSALVNLLLCAVLTPTLGLLGAALGTAVAQGVWNVWMSIAVWRRLGVRATVV